MPKKSIELRLIKHCYECPFYYCDSSYDDTCNATTRDTENWYPSKESPPPHWCPLGDGMILVQLDTELQPDPNPIRDEAYFVASVLKNDGSAFYRSLGELIEKADSFNLSIIKEAFSQTWMAALASARNQAAAAAAYDI